MGYLYKFILYLLCISAAYCDSMGLKNMETEEIVPEVIDNVPKNEIKLLYESDKEVKFGNELTPSDVKKEPQATWNADDETYYTLAMIDPDAPSRHNKSFSQVKHWLVGNILGNDLSEATQIAAYMGSGPPNGTGFHRYIFLVYQQTNKIDFDNEPKTGPWSRQHRLKFNMREFAKKYNLGEPIAGNFFKAQWNSYVEERNKKITN